VLGWNLAIALICGNLVVFKGAPTTNLVSIAVSNIITAVLRKNGFPTSILFTCLGDGVEVGEAMCRDPRVALISFTGSTKIGRHVNKIVAERFGKCILELGGNNAQIVMEDAKLDMALKAAVFGAVGTCG
jgi:aldehyde dehydrogenase family 7 protein A1